VIARSATYWPGRSPALCRRQKTRYGTHIQSGFSDEVDTTLLCKWLSESREIQWDYKNIVKRKGSLERLK